MLIYFYVVIIFVNNVIGQSWKETYPEFDAVAKGFDWEPYKVETEDGWLLTIFRLTGVNGERRPTNEFKEKPPILIQHGAFESATSWVSYGYIWPTLPGQLA